MNIYQIKIKIHFSKNKYLKYFNLLIDFIRNNIKCYKFKKGKRNMINGQIQPSLALKISLIIILNRILHINIKEDKVDNNKIV